MKKIHIFILVIIFLMLISVLCKCGKTKNLYNSYVGKDTIEVYGDGTYQTAHQVKDGNDVSILYNCKYNSCLADDILNIKETENFLYIYGILINHKVYTIINLTDNSTKYFADIEDGEVLGLSAPEMINSDDFILLSGYDNFTKDEQQIFENLSTDQ
ncbi:MAG: hypothetical protein LUC92_03165 [Clostridiales bacterium]|nr:hypothetical protein [Clostridiales bacterium]